MNQTTVKLCGVPIATFFNHERRFKLPRLENHPHKHLFTTESHAVSNLSQDERLPQEPKAV